MAFKPRQNGFEAKPNKYTAIQKRKTRETEGYRLNENENEQQDERLKCVAGSLAGGVAKAT